MDPLGRGLESLIPDKSVEERPVADDGGEPVASLAAADMVVPSASTPDDGAAAQPTARTYQDHFTPRRNDSVFWIEIEKIEANPFQPRREFHPEALQELSASIREHGVLQPILVTKREIETPRGLEVKYQLIAGERRWRAATMAGLSQIPAVIRRGMPDDRIKLELALIENVQREDLNALERARAFKQLVDEFHLVQREVGTRIGKSREFVANTLRLLTLPEEILTAMQKGDITEGHARAILMAGDESTKQFAVYQEIISNGLNVREAENKARQVSGKTLIPRKRAAAFQDPIMREWEARLQERLGTRVHFQKAGERGKIVVEFFSEEELRGILDKLIKEV